MSPTILTPADPTGDAGPGLAAARSARRDRAGVPPADPLPAALLEPIGEGIAGCPALWEPLLRAAVPDGPVVLVATEGYEVWLEVHPPGSSLRTRRPGTTHAVAVAHGALHLRPAGAASSAAVALATGSTTAVPTTTDVVMTAPDPEGAVAVHVHSPPGPRRPSLIAARVPRDVVSFLAHPARGGARPTPAEVSAPTGGGRS
jgi:hypothetical protein